MSVNLWGRMVVNSKAQRFFNEGYMPYQATVALSRTEDGIAWALGDSKFAGAALLDAAVDGTEVVKADTIEELAALMGVDADTLVKSVETYNTACATGNDTEFGKGASNLTAIDAAPYYAVRIYVCTGGTIAGVKTNLTSKSCARTARSLTACTLAARPRTARCTPTPTLPAPASATRWHPAVRSA